MNADQGLILKFGENLKNQDQSTGVELSEKSIKGYVCSVWYGFRKIKKLISNRMKRYLQGCTI